MTWVLFLPILDKRSAWLLQPRFDRSLLVFHFWMYQLRLADLMEAGKLDLQAQAACEASRNRLFPFWVLAVLVHRHSCMKSKLKWQWICLELCQLSSSLVLSDIFRLLTRIDCWRHLKWIAQEKPKKLAIREYVGGGLEWDNYWQMWWGTWVSCESQASQARSFILMLDCWWIGWQWQRFTSPLDWSNFGLNSRRVSCILRPTYRCLLCYGHVKISVRAYGEYSALNVAFVRGRFLPQINPWDNRGREMRSSGFATWSRIFEREKWSRNSIEFLDGVLISTISMAWEEPVYVYRNVVKFWLTRGFATGGKCWYLSPLIHTSYPLPK